MEEKETEHCKTPFIARIFTSISQTSIPDPDVLEDGGGTRSPRSIRCLRSHGWLEELESLLSLTPIRHILQPPTIATLLAFIIGMVPPFKAFVYGDDAPLSFVLDSLEILAGAMVPAVMLILGGMLAEGPNDSKLGIRTTIGISVARLLLERLCCELSFSALFGSTIRSVLSFNVYDYLLQIAAFLCLRYTMEEDSASRLTLMPGKHFSGSLT
ncbi:Protein PIN-LIKES 2 [Camellia lanceoleosa]|uniref:Protein PIN-LIKES 2 n=1 Tax=Camellia lanceoleosa TaxID=1840588 RepID=A0ACC0J6P4_9ERIC|nr:Protein PIN-LIKES 2 [Camellia lanceoleosa]